MDAQAVGRLVNHLVASVDSAPAFPAPFYHLQFTGVFPDDVYAEMLAAIPESGDYRALRGRGDYNMRADCSATRLKIDLFPEYLRQIEPARPCHIGGVTPRPTVTFAAVSVPSGCFCAAMMTICAPALSSLLSPTT